MFTKIRFQLHIHVLVYPFYLAHLKRPNDPAWSSTVKWRINFGPVIEILLSIIFKSCGSNFVLFIGLVQSGPHHLLIENLFACSRHDIAEKLQLNNNHSLVSVFEFCHAYPSLKVNFTWRQQINVEPYLEDADQWTLMKTRIYFFFINISSVLITIITSYNYLWSYQN
jgi:hypothetical protein